MADPRLSVNWAGAHAEYMLFKADDSEITFSASQAGGSDKVDLAVTFDAAVGIISTAANAEFVLGKLVKVESDLMCTVQVGGAMTLPGGDGASWTLGKKIVGDEDGSGNEGYIRDVATGTHAELGVCQGFILDPATTTAIWVFL